MVVGGVILRLQVALSRVPWLVAGQGKRGLDSLSHLPGTETGPASSAGPISLALILQCQGFLVSSLRLARRLDYYMAAQGTNRGGETPGSKV